MESVLQWQGECWPREYRSCVSCRQMNDDAGTVAFFFFTVSPVPFPFFFFTALTHQWMVIAFYATLRRKTTLVSMQKCTSTRMGCRSSSIVSLLFSRAISCTLLLSQRLYHTDCLLIRLIVAWSHFTKGECYQSRRTDKARSIAGFLPLSCLSLMKLWLSPVRDWNWNCYKQCNQSLQWYWRQQVSNNKVHWRSVATTATQTRVWRGQRLWQHDGLWCD